MVHLERDYACEAASALLQIDYRIYLSRYNFFLSPRKISSRTSPILCFGLLNFRRVDSFRHSVYTESC
jgi:hypothetical protein